jgi:hypothetical protein
MVISFGELQQSVHISQFDLLGRKKRSEEFSNTSRLQFNLEGPRGQYILKIVDQNLSEQWIRVAKE